MDYAEVLRAALRTPEEKLRDSRLAGSVMGRASGPEWKPEYQQEPGLELSNPEDWVPGPGTVKALLAKAVLAGKGLATAAGAGIIRKGGDESLVAIHQSPLNRLLAWTDNGKTPRELTHPSIAINRDGIPQDFGNASGTVTFVARPDALDPKNVGGSLWNRDGFTPRRNQFQSRIPEDAIQSANLSSRLAGRVGQDPQEIRSGALRIEAERRNFDRFWPGRGLEEGEVPLEGRGMLLREPGVAPGQFHETSIHLSPDFRSYQGFENSPYGASVLRNLSDDAYTDTVFPYMTQARDKLSQAFPDGIPASGKLSGSGFLQQMHRLNQNGYFTPEQSKAWYEYLHTVKQTPSQYAEQKIPGGVGLHGGNWVGALIRRGDKALNPVSDESVNKLLQSLSARGIPTITTRHPEEEYYLAKWLSEQSK